MVETMIPTMILFAVYPEMLTVCSYYTMYWYSTSSTLKQYRFVSRSFLHTALNILIEPFQNGSVLQWDLMRSDHPENCDVMYELMFNGIVLPYLVSETEIPQGELTKEGFPFCRSTTVLVAPYVSAHDVIRNLTKTTTYLAIPSKRNNTICFVCLHACVSVYTQIFLVPTL